MQTKDLLTIATTALGTATLTVAGFWAGPLGAGSEADAPPAIIANARLVSHGVELGLAPAGARAFKAGEQPEFELTAVNTTDQPASTAVGVTLTASAPANALSRAVRVPLVLWQQEQVVTLNPKETKVLALCATTNLPPNSLISVLLRESGEGAAQAPLGITAFSFSTAAPAAQTGLAALR
jgi:hypothetical protein